MKTFLKFLRVFILAFVSIFVTAWGYQVFWNEVFLNVWQLFTIVDITNTMKVPYGVCVAIAVGLGLIFKGKTDKDKDFEEMISDAIGKIITKLVWIVVVIVTASIVF